MILPVEKRHDASRHGVLPGASAAASAVCARAGGERRCFWVEAPGTRLDFLLSLPGDLAPTVPLEITVREQTFAPTVRGLGYIRVSGLLLRHAADGPPVPQRASISTAIGHHWIIEDCHIDGRMPWA